MRPFVLAAILLAAAVPAQNGPVRATHARFAVDIVDGIATVELALGLHNGGAGIGEADWILPLPEGAVADGFTTRIGAGPEIQGEVLDANRARSVYEAIVRKRRDPGLLEFAGRGCLRARLFPIPPGEDAEVRIRWRQVLPELAGLVRWSHPLAATGIDGRPPEQVTFAVEVRSSTAIRTALSPTPGADVVQTDEHHVVASFEPAPGQALPKELALYYGLSEKAFGLHVLTQRDALDVPGYFALLISPKRDWDDAEIPPRAVTFVLDTSGSMAGRKIDQAKGALRQFLNGLRPVDRFDIVPFSTDAEPFFGDTVEASAENVAKALARVDAIEAHGGTNLGAGLRRGLPDRGPDGRCVPICVLLSDGLPTAGETRIDKLRELAKTIVDARAARIFVLGVGHDVHTVLLDDLADTGRGTRHYVRPDEDIEEKASDLLAKIGRPVMTDLRLTIDGAEATRTTPSQLPDLFAGSRLVVTGRYGQAGHHAVRLRGKVGNVEREYVYDATFPETQVDNDFVPKLWATRRVAALLDEIRRNGQHPELLDEVRQLGVEFQIVTPYTSHLVVEDALGVRVPPATARGSGKRYRGPGNIPPSAPALTPRGGGRTPGPTGPATVGPAGPGTPGPAGPSTPTPRTSRGPTTGGGGGRYTGPGESAPPAPAPTLRSIGERLQEAGVLPKDAKPEEVERLASRVARELQRSAQGLTGLGGKASGARAVDDSVYLARLLDSGAVVTHSDQFFMGSHRVDFAATGRPLHQLFVRRLGDKVFRLREGVWTDAAFDPDSRPEHSVTVVAFSDGYFALLRDRPALTRYIALSDRMKIVLGDTLVEITAAAPEKTSPEPAPHKTDPAGKAD